MNFDGANRLDVLKSWSYRPFFIYHTAFSVLILGGVACATLGAPLGFVGPYLFAAVVVLFCFLLWRDLRIRPLGRKAIPTLLVVLGLLLTAVIVLWGCLFGGEFTSVYPDPWAYSVAGNYFSDPSADPESIVNQFGKSLIGARYATYSLLAIFAKLSGTDTCRASSIWALLTLFHVGLGTVVMSRVLGASRWFSFLAGIFITAIGWAPEVIKIGNWDQVLFMGFLPFLITKLKLTRFRSVSHARLASLGLTLAAAFCTYPEGAAIAGVLFLPTVAIAIFWRSPRWKKLARYIGGAFFFFIFAAVYLPVGISFLRSQFETGNTFSPKGGFWGLLSWQWPAALFGLGDEVPTAPVVWYRFLVPGCLIVLGISGAIRWFRSKEFTWLTLVPFSALTAWQAGYGRYDYGFYKVLTIFWPVAAAMIAMGATSFGCTKSVWKRGAVTGVLLVVCLAAVIDEASYFRYAPWRQERRLADFVKLSQLKTICQNRPIRISTEDWFVQMWAVFFLRDQNLVIPNPLLYLRSVGLVGSATDPTSDTWVLLDEPRKSVAWNSGRLTLLEHPDPVEIVSVEGPNQPFYWSGDPFIWLGNEAEKFTILAQSNMTSRLVVPDVWTGTSVLGGPARTLMLKASDRSSEIPVQKQLSIDLQLHKGTNLVELWCKEPAAPPANAASDAGKWLIGLKGFRIEAE
jgi:hypothetical protein